MSEKTESPETAKEKENNKTALFSLVSRSVSDTESLGARIAREMTDETFFAVCGDLGAGKTAFVRGFVLSLIPEAKVKSPTYSIVNVYRGNGKTINHFDMYRITGEDDLESCGFYDYLDEGVNLCEWCENIPFAVPETYTEIRIEKDPDDPMIRRISAFKIYGSGGERSL